MKKTRRTFPSKFKSRKNYLKKKIDEFNIGLYALGQINFGSGYLPKIVREDLESARKLLYNAACNLITKSFNERNKH